MLGPEIGGTLPTVHYREGREHRFFPNPTDDFPLCLEYPSQTGSHD